MDLGRMKLNLVFSRGILELVTFSIWLIPWLRRVEFSSWKKRKRSPIFPFLLAFLWCSNILLLEACPCFLQDWVVQPVTQTVGRSLLKAEEVLSCVFFYKLEFFKKYLSCCSVTQLCLTLCNPQTAASQASLSFTTSQSLLILMYIESVKPSNLLILYCPLLLLPSIFPSIRVFSSVSSLCIRWPKY